MNRKGMSQTLALIVAAMVLMMTALTVIFMTQGSLTNLFEGSQESSCLSTVRTKCSTVGGSFQAPSSCSDLSDSQITGLSAVDSGSATGTITCAQ